MAPGEAELAEARRNHAAAVEGVVSELADGEADGEAGNREPARAVEGLADGAGQIGVADGVGDEVAVGWLSCTGGGDGAFGSPESSIGRASACNCCARTVAVAPATPANTTRRRIVHHPPSSSRYVQ